MRKLIFLFILILGAVACTPSPKSVVKSFLTALQESDYITARSYTNISYDDWQVYTEFFRSNEFRLDEFKIVDQEITKSWKTTASVEIQLIGNIEGKSTYDDSIELDYVNDEKWVIDGEYLF